MRGLTVFFLAGAVLAPSAWAISGNTPSLADSGVSIGAADWDADELVADDSNSDSAWGSGNDIDNLFLTWDANNLYVGVQASASSNGCCVWIDTGLAGGENNFLASSGYAGAYPRNVNFTGFNIDLLVGAWNGGANWGPGVWTVVDNASTDVSGSCTTQAGTNYFEVSIPWNTVYGLGAGVVPANASLKVVAGIVGGDNWGGPDTAPNNADSNGDGGPDNYSTTFNRIVDANGNGSPDIGVSVPAELSVFSAN